MKKTIISFIFILASFVCLAVSNCQANEIEEKFKKAGLIDVHAIDKSIKVDLVNSDPNKNYFRENLYKGLKKAYLREEVVKKLSLVQEGLNSKFSGYYLKIVDAGRPRSVSQHMYKKV